jgi:hypothetical protein
MDVSRRRLLGATSSLALPLLTGCLGLGDSSGGSGGTTTPTGDSGGGGDAAETATPAPTETATATPEPPREFLERTRRVMDEIRWFGTEYERARRRYLLQIKPVQETIARQRELNTLTASDVAELQSKTEAFAAFVREQLAPHFDVERRLRNGKNGLVTNFAAAVERDDTAAQQDALGRLAIFYDRVATDTYLERNLSAHPIVAPLHSDLQAGGEGKMLFGVSYPPGDNFATQTFSDEYSDRTQESARPHTHTFPTGQTVYAHAHTYGPGHSIGSHGNEPKGSRLYALSEGSVDILADTKAWREQLDDYEPEYTNVFDATVVRQGRVDHAYVMANSYVTKTDSAAQFGSRPIFVQRFEDEETAVVAYETLLSTTLGREGTTTLAGREWTSVFYDYDGPNLYANLYQVGEFILATGVSPTPHRERGDAEQWPAQLKGSWLGMEVADGTTDEQRS